MNTACFLYRTAQKPPLCKGRWAANSGSEGLCTKMLPIRIGFRRNRNILPPQSLSHFALKAQNDCSLYTREPWLSLPFSLFVIVLQKRHLFTVPTDCAQVPLDSPTPESTVHRTVDYPLLRDGPGFSSPYPQMKKKPVHKHWFLFHGVDEGTRTLDLQSHNLTP